MQIRYAPSQKECRQSEESSKRLFSLLWVVTAGGMALAAYCIRAGYVGSLSCLSAMVGLPWTAHGTVCAFYHS